MQYGNYVVTDKCSIQIAKDALLEGLIETIRELAERDDFWIVKHLDEGNPLNVPALANGHDTTVGWKINIPHMGEKKLIQVIRDGEVVGELVHRGVSEWCDP